jgi:hypothetical protein
VEGKLSTLNIEEDEGGVDEYVDMDYRAEKDAPDTYVDMQPSSKITEDQEENGTSTAPKASSNNLRPYLRI